ncbi:hypothetical protein NADFUDRAFT_63699 [Nadsonia fulvescens var. elongata DSM 6958]|uniref:Inner kinetochore subunit AME1 domain-containing protein n=1 Tax=Nadsonia fulvescens var. elongata DSM 6958 TaxID=857566 RepID=A0A1E3PTI0_9ASCO|nr:hypothetical protein NADFUDRAFT_63699 [Nadsonia fulvescens var. elongata DSM 6958]
MNRVRNDKIQARMRGGDAREIDFGPFNITIPESPSQNYSTSPSEDRIEVDNFQASPAISTIMPDLKELAASTIHGLVNDTSQHMPNGNPPQSPFSPNINPIPSGRLSSIVKFRSTSPVNSRPKAVTSLKSVSELDFYKQTPLPKTVNSTILPRSSIPEPPGFMVSDAEPKSDHRKIHSPEFFQSPRDKRPRGRPVGSNKKYRIDNSRSPVPLAPTFPTFNQRPYTDPSFNTSRMPSAQPMLKPNDSSVPNLVNIPLVPKRKRGRPRKYTVMDQIQTPSHLPSVLPSTETQDVLLNSNEDSIKGNVDISTSISIDKPVPRKRGRPRKNVQADMTTGPSSSSVSSLRTLVSETVSVLPKKRGRPQKIRHPVLPNSSSSAPVLSPVLSSSLAQPQFTVANNCFSDITHKEPGQIKRSRKSKVERDLAISHPGPKNVPVPFKSVIRRNGRTTRSTTKAAHGKMITIKMKKILRSTDNIPSVINGVDVVSQVISEYLELVIRKNKEHHQILMEEEQKRAQTQSLSKAEIKVRNSSVEFTETTLNCYKSILSNSFLKLVDLIDLNKRLWKDVKQAQKNREELRKELLEIRDQRGKVSEEMEAVRVDWRKVQQDHEWSQDVKGFVQFAETEKASMSISSSQKRDFPMSVSSSYSNMPVNRVLDRVITKLSYLENVVDKNWGTYGQLEGITNKLG